MYRISRFNHSCAPNCRVVLNELDNIRVIVVAEILKDEELTVSYLPLDWESAGATTVEERREVLQQDWGFHCMCKRCVLEDGVPEYDTASREEEEEANEREGDEEEEAGGDEGPLSVSGEGGALDGAEGEDEEEDANEGSEGGGVGPEGPFVHVDVCEHNRIRSKCMPCQDVCEHNRIRSKCMICQDVCEHNRIRSKCMTCQE